jgi:aspartyl-tRNA(Asn)/glutamyl-tRNA(Gln) amidotransferase subunit C
MLQQKTFKYIVQGIINSSHDVFELLYYGSRMAKLTDEDILKLARLSRLHLSDDEKAHFKAEIEAILEYVEQLQNVDLQDVTPTNQVTGLENVMRQDVIKDYGTTQAELLKNAPDQQNGLIKVRRVL